MASLNDARKFFDYNPITGVIKWKVNRGSVIAGDVAGYINQGYRKLSFNGEKYQAHRMAWFLHYGKFPDGSIDHINGNPQDNKIANLRDVTNKENSRNQRTPRNSTTRCIGVSWVKQRKLYQAYICVDGVDIALGRFRGIGDAIAARSRANVKYGFHQNHGRSA